MMGSQNDSPGSKVSGFLSILLGRGARIDVRRLATDPFLPPGALFPDLLFYLPSPFAPSRHPCAHNILPSRFSPFSLSSSCSLTDHLCRSRQKIPFGQ